MVRDTECNKSIEHISSGERTVLTMTNNFVNKYLYRIYNKFARVASPVVVAIFGEPNSSSVRLSAEMIMIIELRVIFH